MSEPVARRKSKPLTRAEILQTWQAEDKPLPIEMPEWGGVVYAKRLSAGEVTQMGDDQERIPYRALVRSVVDAEGKRIFTDQDVDALRARPYATMVKLLKTVMEHNGMSAESAEELVRDFAETDIGNGSSGSPSPLASQQQKRESVSAPTS